ncbi:MAG: hypothetical protein FD187_3220, partial [bacterium]
AVGDMGAAGIPAIGTAEKAMYIERVTGGPAIGARVQENREIMEILQAIAPGSPLPLTLHPEPTLLHTTPEVRRLVDSSRLQTASSADESSGLDSGPPQASPVDESVRPKHPTAADFDRRVRNLVDPPMMRVGDLEFWREDVLAANSANLLEQMRSVRFGAAVYDLDPEFFLSGCPIVARCPNPTAESICLFRNLLLRWARPGRTPTVLGMNTDMLVALEVDFTRRVTDYLLGVPPQAEIWVREQLQHFQPIRNEEDLLMRRALGRVTRFEPSQRHAVGTYAIEAIGAPHMLAFLAWLRRRYEVWAHDVLATGRRVSAIAHLGYSAPTVFRDDWVLLRAIRTALGFPITTAQLIRAMLEDPDQLLLEPDSNADFWEPMPDPRSVALEDCCTAFPDLKLTSYVRIGVRERDDSLSGIDPYTLNDDAAPGELLMCAMRSRPVGLLVLARLTYGGTTLVRAVDSFLQALQQCRETLSTVRRNSLRDELRIDE